MLSSTAAGISPDTAKSTDRSQLDNLLPLLGSAIEGSSAFEEKLVTLQHLQYQVLHQVGAYT